VLRAIAAPLPLVLGLVAAILGSATAPRRGEAAAWREPPIPCASPRAVTLGRDLDGDGDADEIDIHLEVAEIQEEIYPGRFETFWVFAPEGQGMCSPARLPSPTIRVEVGDHVRIHLHNTHYLPHTIHLHGTIHSNAMDGVPDFTQPPVMPGKTFTYEFVATQPGTFWYHCHVQPDVHVLMGLAGMLIIEPNRPRNHFRHVIVGAGRIDDLARAEREQGFTSEYSLVYMDMDDRLNAIPASTPDPREIEARMHRDYDSTQRQPDIFLLNGRSFPFTLRDTPIRVRPHERVRLRILNAGARTLNLHVHGHHPRLIALDGYDVPAAVRQARDVFTLGPAQRADLELRTGNDGYFASGPGVWLVHDHTEQATTNRGINPGGDLTVLVYEGFEEPDGLPRVATSLQRFFDPDYYRGKVPVFDPSIFHTTREYYSEGWSEEHPSSSAPYPTRSAERAPRVAATSENASELEEHRALATSCPHPRTFQRIVMKEGARSAREGEVYGFEPRVIHAEPCQEVEVVLENTDSVRHALMIPNLDPMFVLEFAGPGTRRAHFVTPDRDITLPFHCHVPLHEKVGMRGELVVGSGGRPEPAPETGAKRLWQGVGTVVSADLRKSRLVVNHEEIPGFMAAMTMSYAVTRPELLQRLQPGEHIRFSIDAERRAIVDITPVPK
jgi:FtsP/CotA-like multicopper oxidase with cupredoxin domain/Cu/Ag efflux protein CusF